MVGNNWDWELIRIMGKVCNLRSGLKSREPGIAGQIDLHRNRREEGVIEPIA